MSLARPFRDPIEAPPIRSRAPVSSPSTLVSRLRRRVIDVERWVFAGLKIQRTPNVVPVRDLAELGLPVSTSQNGGVVLRKPAKIIGAPLSLQREMAAYESIPIIPPPASVVRIADATLSGGIVQLPDGTIVAESLIKNAHTGRFRRGADGSLVQVSSRRRRRLGNGPHVLLKQHHDGNYGHWLVEGLPRLGLVEDHFALGDLKYIISGHHGPMRAIYEDSLALYGIRRDQIVEAGCETIRVDDLIYPAPMTRHPWHFAPRCVDVLEQLATRVKANPFGFERLYVSRNRAMTRRLLNEPEIVAIAERHGFVFVEPETLTLYQQIGLFRSARIVVGPYGAALANTAFATGDVTLFALTTPSMQDDFFSTLMSLKRGGFLSQHGTTVEETQTSHTNFHIDPHIFEALLRSIV